VEEVTDKPKFGQIVALPATAVKSQGHFEQLYIETENIQCTDL